ncbi:alpha/beta hydrolase [Waterburya agarophytonicola K14]|uniref:Alpha/beta hydrolase n=1 Tax=Waterburya agarophytonicola KI4 TaxID=2874699 RepID=A0A964BTG9_9CYAN|nr:alpha/beta hydrolase [Waterburya agarophytonicola]MCC0177961.1 alpha/beta hydrolase [Waterburya agarophytonicola KI4]
MTDNNNPQFLLFAQHGWADNGNSIGRLARAVATPKTIVTVPSLGLIKTFISIEPLVRKLEQIATAAIEKYPHTPLKIIGHSMGGLMWLEVLDRNPQWWHKVHSLILLGSPVGGSNLARIIDPFGIGIGTAKCLGRNRRLTAEKIAQHIPTLSVASDINMGTDGLVTLENTKFDYANWLLVSDIPHSAMRSHPQMISIIQNFWTNPNLGSPPDLDSTSQFIQRLRRLPGMTDTDYRNFKRSQIVASLADGATIHTWKNYLGVNHVYVGKPQQQCIYAGYVGLIHAAGLEKAIATLVSDNA